MAKMSDDVVRRLREQVGVSPRGTARPTTGEARDSVVEEIRRRYVDKQQSMRAIGKAIGRSYGFVNRVVTRELHITPRGRGGARTAKAAARNTTAGSVRP